MSQAAAWPFPRARAGRLLPLAVVLLLALLTPVPAESVEPGPDGRSVATAAASCWEIHRNDPSAPSGTYWLWTPALMAPQQFHCDMERAGGGWVLIGRGREGWQTTYNGVGDPARLLEPRTDFTTTQLSAQTVDGLLGGRPVRGLHEGVRVRRAMNAAGTTWQEVRFTLPDRGRWAWTFGAGHRVGDFSFVSPAGRTKGAGGNSRKFGKDDGFQQVVTSSPEEHDYTQSFSYGRRVIASPDESSFLWTAVAGQGYARPYAEAYLRPRLTTADFPDIPASGTRPVLRRAVASTWADPIAWGVTGLASEHESEGHIEVQALAEAGGRLFVGGNFTTVQRGRDAKGSDLVAQPYLAAFDIRTGEHLPQFDAMLDGEVQALEAMPGGRLAVGGLFTRAGGRPATGVAVLDAATGAATDFGLTLQNQGAGVSVRDIELVGDRLYLSGAFVSAASTGSLALRVGNAVRVSTAGVLDRRWNPLFNGEVNDSAASPNGRRIYFAGHFTRTGDTATRRVAAVRTGAAAELARRWNPVWSVPDKDYQRAVAVTSGRVWVGGSQHSVFSFDARTLARRSTSISAGSGGDFQTIATGKGVTYGGCHCNAFNFQGADEFGPRIRGWSQADKINWVGAWTGRGKYIAEFSPMMRSAEGAGVWASLVDSSGALWAGGDLRSVQTGPTTSAWVGSFTRFPLQDHQAPTRPGTPGATTQSAGQVLVSWTASTDQAGAVTYEVLRNDRVVATTAATSVVVPGQPTDRFFVRAVDPTGNRSASTAAVTPGG